MQYYKIQKLHALNLIIYSEVADECDSQASSDDDVAGEIVCHWRRRDLSHLKLRAQFARILQAIPAR